MLDQESSIQTAYDIARSGKFRVHATYDGEKVPKSDIERYEEDAWLLVRNVTIDELDEAYTMMLFAGTDPDDMTPDEIMRYIASSAQSDYDNLRIDYVLFT